MTYPLKTGPVPMLDLGLIKGDYNGKGGNSYGHPHEETVQAFNEIEAEIYGTDIHDTIVVITDG